MSEKKGLYGIWIVVIGILIALSINNYNEDLKQQESVKLYLKNFVADLRKDQETMQTVMEAQSFRFHALQYLLVQVGEDIYDPTSDQIMMPEFIPGDIWREALPEAYDREFVGLAFLWSHRSVSQNLTTATIDELKSTGVFSLIESHELKDAINGYYDYWSHRLGDRNQAKFYEQVAEWEASIGEDGLFTNDFQKLVDPLSVIRSNDKRIYLVKKLVREAAWIVQVAEGVNDYAEALADHIEAHFL